MAIRRGRIIRAPRRKSTWFVLSPQNVTIAAASTAVQATTLNAAALALRPFTVVRTHWFWHVKSDQFSANERWGCNIGWAVVSDQASAIGVTAVPTPITDQDSDLFFAMDSMYGELAFTTGVGYREVGGSNRVDSKAMRKVEIGQTIVVTLETPSFAPSADVVMSGRFLVKLS